MAYVGKILHTRKWHCTFTPVVQGYCEHVAHRLYYICIKSKTEGTLCEVSTKANSTTTNFYRLP